MRTETQDGSFLVVPDGSGPFPGVVVIHYGVPSLKAALGTLALRPEVDADRLGAIGFCLVVGSWPGRDFTTKAARILATELTAARVPHDLKVYPGAKHSFFNDRWRTYDPEAAADSWERVLAFFDIHVRGGAAS